MPRYAITGASGGGKSTLVDALAARGFATVPEVGRQLVADEVEAGGDALPWADREAFMRKLFRQSLDAYDAVPDDPKRAVFFDRSFIEAIAYAPVIGVAVPDGWREAAAGRPFADPVFVCPPWPEIFGADAERRHDFAFAERDYAANIAAYRAAGYRLAEIPRLPIDGRVRFVLETLTL